MSLNETHQERSVSLKLIISVGLKVPARFPHPLLSLLS